MPGIEPTCLDIENKATAKCIARIGRRPTKTRQEHGESSKYSYHRGSTLPPHAPEVCTGKLQSTVNDIAKRMLLCERGRVGETSNTQSGWKWKMHFCLFDHIQCRGELLATSERKPPFCSCWLQCPVPVSGKERVGQLEKVITAGKVNLRTLNTDKHQLECETLQKLRKSHILSWMWTTLTTTTNTPKVLG